MRELPESGKPAFYDVTELNLPIYITTYLSVSANRLLTNNYIT